MWSIFIAWSRSNVLIKCWEYGKMIIIVQSSNNSEWECWFEVFILYSIAIHDFYVILFYNQRGITHQSGKKPVGRPVNAFI